MPLHREKERMLEARFERFNDAVRRASDGDEIARYVSDRLMMQRVRDHPRRADQRAQPSIAQPDVVAR